MLKLEELKQIIRDFSDMADFLVVYIAEAHSTDGWAFSNNLDIDQHRSLEDRLAAARVLVQALGPEGVPGLGPGPGPGLGPEGVQVQGLCPVVVDEMSDGAAVQYGAEPDRLYVLQAGKVVYKGGVGPWGYNPAEVRSVLEKMK